MLTRGEDYAFGQPSLTRKKLRRLELQAGAKRGQVKPGIWGSEHRHAPRRARTRPPSRARLQAQRRRLAGNEGRERDTGTRIFKAV